MSEQIAQVPLLEQVAADLQQSGEYKRQLSATDVEEILSGAVSQLVSERDDVGVALSNLSVEIKESGQRPRDGEAVILGRLDIAGELATGSLDVKLGLINHPRDNSMILCPEPQLKGDIDIHTPLGVGTDVKALISDKIMGTMLQRSISNWLGREMKERGTKFDKLSLHLLPESLQIILA